MFALVLFLSVFSAAASGGQVVTEELRQWAREALKEEKALQALQGRNTAAVLYFSNKTGRPELDPVQKGMALMLITDLSGIEGIQVIERARIQALTEETGLAVSGLVDPDTAPRVGRLLGARWLVGGDILREGGTAPLRIQSNLLDVPAAEILGGATAGGSLDDLFRMEKDLLFRIVELLKIELTPAQKAALKRPCSTSSTALLAFFKGIDASDRGDYEEAARLYESALKYDPDICMAGDALRELKTLGLVTAAKRSTRLLQSLRDSTSLTDQLTPESPVKRAGRPEDTPVPVGIDITFPEQ
ncbi:MAG: hypothetical protein GXP46_13185 [Deferribacteres bacterium]|nr:hypothetical protein [Deferribacteres bacterium]